MAFCAFSASPRKGGNSEILLGRAVEGLVEAGGNAEIVRVSELDIAPCTGCGACMETGRCVIDDVFGELRERIISSDGIIFATPLYFMNVPARGKALIDRCQAFWAAKHRLGIDLFGGRRRPGLFIACAGARRGPGGTDIFRGVKDTMTYVFDALGIDPVFHLTIAGVDEAGDVLGQPGVLESARVKGCELARYIKV